MRRPRFVLLSALALVLMPMGVWPAMAAPTGVSSNTMVLDAVAEVEPNDVSGQAQKMTSIGTAAPISASIGTAGDKDWFGFDAENGKTYVVELFNVDNALNIAGTRCSSTTGSTGLNIVAYRSNNSELRRRCDAKGAGDVHSLLEVTADATGLIYVAITASNTGVTGTYNLRVLPKHDEPNASWDAQTFEPNNSRWNAYPIKLGAANALSVGIEPRTGSYASNNADEDWFTFQGELGKSYVVETYDVRQSVTANRGTNCAGDTSGLGMIAYMDADQQSLTSRCEGAGAGNVHNIMEVVPTRNATIYVRVVPSSDADYGYYKIRVLPRYDDPAATWDTDTLEPNNRATNAYPIGFGPTKAVSSKIDQRLPEFDTRRGDEDWYRFEGTQDTQYVIEVLKVDASLGSASGSACGGETTGLGVQVYDAIGTQAALKSQCAPNGAGIVHNILEYTAAKSGTFFVRVIASNASSSGAYTIRVVPYWGSNDSWDAAGEPNNRAANAFGLSTGLRAEFSAAIEPVDAAYSSLRADTDWYRINVVAGELYKIDLLNVANTLTTAGGTGCGKDGSGLGMILYDNQLTRLKDQCTPRPRDNAYSRMEFTATTTGVMYIQVVATSNALYGSYQIKPFAESDIFKIFMPIMRNPKA